MFVRPRLYYKSRTENIKYNLTYIVQYMYGHTPCTVHVWPHPMYSTCMATPYVQYMYDHTLCTVHVWPHPMYSTCMTTPYVQYMYDHTLCTVHVWPHPMYSTCMATPIKFDIKNPIALITKSVIADAFLFVGIPLHVKSFAEPIWSARSS